MLGVPNEQFLLSIIMLNIVMLSVIMLNIIMLSVIMLNVIVPFQNISSIQTNFIFGALRECT